ncbi:MULTISPECIES: PLP-dependent aminotransferase family protein [unclassified Pandoraea]|uniref:aminotransferase-like domain-containing protein n=1 Tax=unclassified Pandoraea TaxID=2624094 RepID=UPI00058469CC|nr:MULTISPECIES: PLP-dependent aminotransferase family protein [unclassified Pandoraea]OJY24114.1 MAG: GntR family transcriptional regulator [Pandoraea sp. 64-18]
MKRYLQLAAEFESLMLNGTLEPGVRLPSVRRASSSYRVSPSTVFHAYYTLERRGLIVARPRSGYFVASGPASTKALTLVSKHSVEDAGGDSLTIRFMRAQRRCAHPWLGSSEPCAKLFPFSRIARALAAAIRRMASSRNALSAGEVEADLRRQIALRYVVTGVAVPIEEVVVTSGALDATMLCLQVLTRPGDTIAIERPAFHAVRDVVKRLRLKAVEIPVDPHHGLDLGVLEEALRQRPVRACWFMTTLHQPTGATLSDERKQALVRLLAIYGVPLIEDDVFRELHFGLTPAYPAKRFDAKGLVLHCGSFSTSLAPGLHLGWVAAGRYARRIEHARWLTMDPASVPVQCAIAGLLEHGDYDRLLRKLRRELASLQTRMVAAVVKYFPKGTLVVRPPGGFFLWVQLPEGVGAVQLFEMAEAHEIAIAPGAIFSCDSEFRRHIRINYGRPWTRDVEKEIHTLGTLARRAVAEQRAARHAGREGAEAMAGEAP